MAIADKIASIKTHLTEAYDAIEGKGGELPEQKNLASLAEAIENLPAGAEEINFAKHPEAYVAIKAISNDLDITVFYIDSEEDALNILNVTYEFDQLGFLQALEVAFSPKAAELPTTEIGDYFLKYKSLSGDSWRRPGLNPIKVSGLENLTQIKTLGNSFLEQGGMGGGMGEESPFDLVTITGLPPNVTKIGEAFLNGRTKFNSPITLPEGLVEIGRMFMYQCESFNYPLIFPDGITEIGESTLYHALAFNSELHLPASLQTLGGSFMSTAIAFAQPFSIPDGVSVDGTNFLDGCVNFVGPLNVGTSTVGSQWLQYCLSVSIETAPMYVQGVRLTGANAQAWKAQLPDSSSRPYRRILVG